MELVERYLNEVGKRLPPENRDDIVAELRSSLEDAVDTRADGTPTDQDVAAVLREMGSPESVAASYYPEGRYLIGPALFPLFRMILGIVLAAVVGAQLLALAVGVVFAGETISIWRSASGILLSLPAAFGIVVIIFAILERFEVEPDEEPEDEFDPLKLPPVEEEERVSRLEQALSVLFGVLFLALLAQFYSGVGLTVILSNPVIVVGFLSNPVITQYFPWIALVLLFGIVIDIVLLWRGRWQLSTRIAKLAQSLLSLVLISFILQGLASLLSQADIVGFTDALDLLPTTSTGSLELVGLAALRLALTIAFIVIAIEAVVQGFRLARDLLTGRTSRPTELAPLI